MMTKEETIAYFLEKKQEGMDYSEIRSVLRSKGYKEDEMSEIIRSVDKQLLQGVHQKTDRTTQYATLVIGAVLLLFGLIVTIGTYSGMINMKGDFLIAYGPILSGAGMLTYGMRRRSNYFDRKHKFRG